jgi:hypothetical protein
MFNTWSHAIPPSCFRAPSVSAPVRSFHAVAHDAIDGEDGKSSTASHRSIAVGSLSLFFGNIQLGNSLTRFESLTNSGTSTVTISQAKVTGPGFGVRGLALPVTLASGQSVTFRVVCTPLAAGSMTGTIGVVSNAATPS